MADCLTAMSNVAGQWRVQVYVKVALKVCSSNVVINVVSSIARASMAPCECCGDDSLMRVVQPHG